MKTYWIDKWDLKDYYKEKSELKPIKMVAVDELLELIKSPRWDDAELRKYLTDTLSNEKTREE